jgi:uncharacterized protein (TIGR02271 family)
MMQSNSNALKSLRELGGYEVSSEDPDVRGWTVIGANGERLGTVSDLVVDTERMKVEYLSVDGDGGTDQMIPVATAQLDRSQREVVIGGIASGISSGTTTSDYAEQRRETTSNERDRTTLTRAEEELRIGKRQVAAGEVVVGKHVEVDRVSEPVSVERERVRVERRPVTDDMTARAADIGSDEIRVPIMEEELIVEKRPVVKEELVISKERIHDTETVETEVRREEFDVEGTPDTLLDESDSTRRGRR